MWVDMRATRTRPSHANADDSREQSFSSLLRVGLGSTLFRHTLLRVEFGPSDEAAQTGALRMALRELQLDRASIASVFANNTGAPGPSKYTLGA